jgi:hypothetical protein
MTRYEVNWLDDAFDDVVQYWLDAQDSEQKSRIRRATDDADRVLVTDPKRNADHLSEGLWRLEVPPLRLYFVIDEGQHLVDVTGVGLVQME